MDKKILMKRAWEIKREDNRNIFSLCLKMAWAELKETKVVKAVLKGYDWMVARAEEIRDCQIKLSLDAISKYNLLATNNKGNEKRVAVYTKAVAKIKNALTKYVAIEDAKYIYEHKNAMGYGLNMVSDYVCKNQ